MQIQVIQAILLYINQIGLFPSVRGFRVIFGILWVQGLAYKYLHCLDYDQVLDHEYLRFSPFTDSFWFSPLFLMFLHQSSLLLPNRLCLFLNYKKKSKYMRTERRNILFGLTSKTNLFLVNRMMIIINQKRIPQNVISHIFLSPPN